MIKLIIIFGTLLTIVYCASIDSEARIISESNKPSDGDGTYAYNYETSNGIVAYENGQGGVSANGGYRWQSPDGSPFEITYVANEDGFQPQGEHIKQIADNVAKLIAFLKANPSDDDGSYKPSKY